MVLSSLFRGGGWICVCVCVHAYTHNIYTNSYLSQSEFFCLWILLQIKIFDLCWAAPNEFCILEIFQFLNCYFQTFHIVKYTAFCRFECWPHVSILGWMQKGCLPFRTHALNDKCRDAGQNNMYSRQSVFNVNPRFSLFALFFWVQVSTSHKCLVWNIFMHLELVIQWWNNVSMHLFLIFQKFLTAELIKNV